MAKIKNEAWAAPKKWGQLAGASPIIAQSSFRMAGKQQLEKICLPKTECSILPKFWMARLRMPINEMKINRAFITYFFACFPWLSLIVFPGCSHSERAYIIPFSHFGFLKYASSNQGEGVELEWYIKDSFSTPVEVNVEADGDKQALYVSIYGKIVPDEKKWISVRKEAGIFKLENGRDGFVVRKDAKAIRNVFYRDADGLHEISRR